MSELYSAFKKAIPTSQVSFATDVYPGARNKLSYDYKTLATVVDFFMPMAYRTCEYLHTSWRTALSQA